MDPPFLMAKRNLIFTFSPFSHFTFWWFWSFSDFDKVPILWHDTFLHHYIKALLLTHKGSMMMCGGFSPLFDFDIWGGFLFFIFHVGEITQGGVLNYTLVLPSVLFLNFIDFVVLFGLLVVGEIHRRGDVVFNSHSPLYCFVVFNGLSSVY